MCCILCVCIYVITLYCIYGMFLIDYGTPVLFKSLFLKLFIKALLSRLLDTSAIEIHYYYYYYYYYINIYIFATLCEIFCSNYYRCCLINCIPIITCVVYDRLSCKMKHIAFDFFLQIKFQKGGHYITSLYMYIYIVLHTVCVVVVYA